MWHPLAGLTTSGLTWLFMLSLIGTGFVFVALESLGRRLRTHVAPRGIASLESADTPEVCQSILASWNDLSHDAAQHHLTLDFVFIPLYTTLLTILGIAASRWFAASGLLWLSNLAMILAWTQWLIGLLEIASNCAMMRILQVHPDVPEGLPPLSAWCARIKIFVLFMAGFFGIFGLLSSFTS
jgi:hypothetical protein